MTASISKSQRSALLKPDPTFVAAPLPVQSTSQEKEEQTPREKNEQTGTHVVSPQDKGKHGMLLDEYRKRPRFFR